MTPSEHEELEACLRRVSEILYNNSNGDNLESLEAIETTVRAQVLEHVSPKIGFFLSEKKRKQIEEEKGP
jgi:hypothetical protein